MLLAALLLGGVVWWTLATRSEPDVARSHFTLPPQNGDAPPAPATDEFASAEATPSSSIRERPVAANAANGDDAAPAALLRVRLRGLHPDAPWTTPLDLHFTFESWATNATHIDRATVASDGLAQFALPTWWRRGAAGRITASDPRYRSIDHRWTGAIDVTQELVVDVQVVAELHGRVVDARGKPVIAYVAAFPFADAAKDIGLGTTATDTKGEWRLQVPPGESLLIVAQPTWPGLNVVRRTSTSFSSYEMRDGGAQLLPASQHATCVAGAVTELPMLVLPDATALRGSVRWEDGAPIVDAWAQLLPRGGTELHVQDSTSVRRHDNGRFATSAQAKTDANGAFVLPMLDNSSADVQLVTLGDAADLANRHVVQPITGSTVEFRLPRAITLRAMANGEPMRDASFEVDSWQRPIRTTKGTLAIVPNAAFRVRATKDTLCSSWRDVGPADASATIDLPLTANGAGEVKLAFEGGSSLGTIYIAWRSSDGREGGQFVRQVDSASTSLFLEPGRHRLVFGEHGRLWNQIWFVPFETDVVVGAEPVTVTIPARRGGALFVHATDERGIHVAGTCRVFDTKHDDVTDVFAVDRYAGPVVGAPGELLVDGPNRLTRILPPGEYELLLDFPGRGQRRERATLREREITRVHVRL